MKRSVILFTIVSFLSFGDSFAKANQGGFSLLVNIPAPMGNFGEVKGIRTGLGFGIEYTYPIAPGLSWITSTSLLLNGVDNSNYLKGKIGMIPPGIIKGRFYNIPILTGFKFHGLTPRTISGYGMAQIGLKFVKHPNISGENWESSFEFAKSFGFGIGGGLVFYDKFNVGIQIYRFDEAKIKGEKKYDGKIEAMWKFNQSVSMFLVTFGIKL